MGLCDDAVRLPLVKITENTKKEVEKALKVAKLLMSDKSTSGIKIITINRKASFNFSLRNLRSRNCTKRF